MAWEVISVGMVGLIFIFCYLAVNLNTETPKFNYLKVLFLWFAFTLVIPALYSMKLIASINDATTGNVINYALIGYFPVYTIMVYIIFVMFIKDFLLELAKKKENE